MLRFLFKALLLNEINLHTKFLIAILLTSIVSELGPGVKEKITLRLG
jgi:hypothetical protein